MTRQSPPKEQYCPSLPGPAGPVSWAGSRRPIISRHRGKGDILPSPPPHSPAPSSTPGCSQWKTVGPGSWGKQGLGLAQEGWLGTVRPCMQLLTGAPRVGCQGWAGSQRFHGKTGWRRCDRVRVAGPEARDWRGPCPGPHGWKCETRRGSRRGKQKGDTRRGEKVNAKSMRGAGG